MTGDGAVLGEFRERRPDVCFDDVLFHMSEIGVPIGVRGGCVAVLVGLSDRVLKACIVVGVGREKAMVSARFSALFGGQLGLEGGRIRRWAIDFFRVRLVYMARTAPM